MPKSVRGIQVPLPDDKFQVPEDMERMAMDVVSIHGDTMTGKLTFPIGEVKRAAGINSQFMVTSGGTSWVVECNADGSFVIDKTAGAAGRTFSIDPGTEHVYLAPVYGAGASNANRPNFLVVDNTNGHVAPVDYDHVRLILGISSTRRYKTDIQPALNVPDVSTLKPVGFRWNQDVAPLTGEDTPQLGLIAEDVDAVDPRLATHDGEGRPDGLNTNALIAALVDKVQKLEARIEALEA